MGRNGDAIRAAKKLNAVYNPPKITGQWLAEHDRQVIEAYKRDIEGRMQRTADRYVREYFDKIGEEFNSGDEDADVHTMMSYLLSVSVRVLIEDFGWKPPRYQNCRKTKTERFAERVLEVIDDIRNDERKDIRDYAKETADLYGVRFTMEATDDI